MDPNLYSANFGMQPEADQASSSENPTPVVQTTDGADATDDTLTKTDRDPRYPMAVQYCGVCSLPGEVHAYVSRSQFEK